MILHATAVARFGREGWRAVLLMGPSGAGKSDLALRALHTGWRLVADDGAVVWTSGGRLWVRAHDNIGGRIEARGAGILAARRLDLAPVVLVVRCGQERPERLPEPDAAEVIEGVSIPRLDLDPLESSALAKLDRVLSTRVLGA